MNADQRGWIRMIAVLAIIGATAMASPASGAEPLFLLTSQIERLGGEELALDDGTPDVGSELCNSIGCGEFHLADICDGKSASVTEFRVAPGVRVKRVLLKPGSAPGDATPLPPDIQTPSATPTSPPRSYNWTIASV
jgi:hypothetical protein